MQVPRFPAKAGQGVECRRSVGGDFGCHTNLRHLSDAGCGQLVSLIERVNSGRGMEIVESCFHFSQPIHITMSSGPHLTLVAVLHGTLHGNSSSLRQKRDSVESMLM
jgi:hypothetical protein